MRPPSISALVAALLLTGSGLVNSARAQAGATTLQPDTGSAAWQPVDRAIGRAGKPQPGAVWKYSFPRSDLHVRVGDVALKPALALGGWVAFRRSGGDAMAMGDLVLAEGEVAPVMAKLQEGGVELTALHNHLQGELPRVMYLHVEGRGDPVRIARAIHAALDFTKTPPVAPAASGASAPFGIDTAQIARSLGHGGAVNGGVYQVSVARAETVHAGGMEVPPAMGVATGINFQPTTNHKAAVTGDFVLIASEVNPVIRALRGAGITVTAVHSHMLGETPRLLFLHFWAHDDAVTLAHGLRSALDRMNTKK